MNKTWELRWGRDWDSPQLPFDWWIYENGTWLGAITRVGNDRLYRFDLPNEEPIFGDFGNVRSQVVELRREDQIVGTVSEPEDKPYAWDVDVQPHKALNVLLSGLGLVHGLHARD